MQCWPRQQMPNLNYFGLRESEAKFIDLRGDVQMALVRRVTSRGCRRGSVSPASSLACSSPLSTSLDRSVLSHQSPSPPPKAYDWRLCDIHYFGYPPAEDKQAVVAMHLRMKQSMRRAA
mmetsp:Transcript_28227/g.87955  ORF Transcript_28227/g.87955 Transcript_28227/m.87955 type:complete len:119 (+) Transcript_28227:50-406(+)